jgi:hypothetical protein
MLQTIDKRKEVLPRHSLLRPRGQSMLCRKPELPKVASSIDSNLQSKERK